MLVVFCAVIVITLILFVIMGLGFRAMEWNGFIAFILSLLLAWSIKYAFVDSWIMVKMVQRYMALAESTPPAIDLYGKLTEWSTSFKELWSKGKKSSPESSESAPTATTDTGTDTSEPLAEANEGKKQVMEERIPLPSPDNT